MTRFLAILAALTCAASAQTYRTVTADTNNVIRTNFSLTRSQVSDLDGAAFAISNITGLQSALDGKLATNGSAAGLSNFPSSLLTTNGDAFALTNFPSELLRTNGDGSGLINLPNADLGSATGILPLANGGTGATNASEARTALELGTAATNAATDFQAASTNLTALASGDGSSLTNVTITDASTLTNFPAELLRTNGDGSGLTGIAVYPTLSNNAGLVLAVTTNEAGVEWIAVSNTVTDAASLTNYPAYLLQTNGDAAGLTNFPAELLRTNGDASALTGFPGDLLRTNGDAAGLTNFPTLNQNTTGTASNVTGIVQITNGGTGTNSAAGARVNLLPSYTGNSNKVLAVNAGETDVEWVVQSGGGGLTSPVAVVDGGTGATNGAGALTNLGVITSVGGIRIGTPPTYDGDKSVIIGKDSTNKATTAGVAIGWAAKSLGGNSGVAVGVGAQTYSGFSGGPGADSFDGGAAGNNATTYVGGAVGHDATSVHGGAVGRLADAEDGGAIGFYAQAINGFAGGNYAKATGTNGSQIGTGTNANDNTIQFMSAGSVTTNSWSALANAGTIGTNVLQSTNAAGAQAAIFPATTTNAPSNTNAPTPDAWLDVMVGTNAYKLPLWQ